MEMRWNVSEKKNKEKKTTKRGNKQSTSKSTTNSYRVHMYWFRTSTYKSHSISPERYQNGTQRGKKTMKKEITLAFIFLSQRFFFLFVFQYCFVRRPFFFLVSHFSSRADLNREQKKSHRERKKKSVYDTNKHRKEKNDFFFFGFGCHSMWKTEDWTTELPFVLSNGVFFLSFFFFCFCYFDSITVNLKNERKKVLITLGTCL